MFSKQKQKINHFVTNIIENRLAVNQPQPMLAFSVHLAEHCNLNCKSCAHFSPLCKEEFADFNEFSRDMERLSELSDGEMRYCDLLGGEPLLNKDISSFIKKARECFPVGHLRIITNGLLLRQMNETFWDRIRADRCDICISKYSNNIDYDSLLDYVKSKSGGGVLTWYVDYTKVGFWTRDTTLAGMNDPVRMFFKCIMANTCHFLSHGKLYTCVKPANIKHFNAYFNTDIKVSPRDGINIYEAQNLQEIMEFLAKPIPFCRYCDFSNMIRTNGMHISEKDIHEWIVEREKQ